MFQNGSPLSARRTSASAIADACRKKCGEAGSRRGERIESRRAEAEQIERVEEQHIAHLAPPPCRDGGVLPLGINRNDRERFVAPAAEPQEIRDFEADALARTCRAKADDVPVESHRPHAALSGPPADSIRGRAKFAAIAHSPTYGGRCATRPGFARYAAARSFVRRPASRAWRAGNVPLPSASSPR